jgi:myo-inositol 2-dehydrogenase / D-chiro-inositol 1-dehydrogenase
LAGVVEPFAPARASVAQTGIATYESVEELLAGSIPGGVLIVAPSDRHAQLVSRFAAAGVATLCEKPVGVNVEQARQAAAAAAAAAGILLRVGYWRRFVPELQALRRRIAAGALGEIIQLSCFQWDHELPTEAFRSHSGGIAVDMGSTSSIRPGGCSARSSIRSGRSRAA